MQFIDGGRIVLQFQFALAKPQQRIHIVGLEGEDAFKCMLGLLPFGELHIRDRQQLQGGHIVGLGFNCARGILRGPGKIHQLVIRHSNVIINPRQRSIRALRLEQPLQSRLAISRAAQQFSVLLPHRWIVGLGLQTLPDGAQRQVVLPIQVIGLGKIILCVSVAGKNPDAVLAAA